MTGGWLVYALVTGTLCAVGTYALSELCRLRGWPTRWSWMLGLSTAFLLLALSAGRTTTVLMTAELPVATGTDSRGAVGASGIGPIARVAIAVRTAMRETVVGATRRLPRWIGPAFQAAWFLLSAGVLLTLAIAALRLRAARRGWPMADVLGHRVRIAPAAGPAVVGVLQPEIVLPRWLLGRTAAEQGLVLAHEQEHLRGRDHLLLGAGCAAVALVPWHPAVWWMLARLRLAIEVDCDARVLRRGIARHSYGSLLIDLASQCSGFRIGATALADRTSHLERRLLAMTSHPARYTILRAAALLAFGGLATLAACEARVPTSAEIDAMDASGAEKVASSANLIDGLHKGPTTFYVDGVQRSADEAHAIPAQRIASIDVRRADGASEIRLTTLADGATKPAGSGVRVNVTSTKGGAAAANGMASMHEKMRGGSFDGVVFIDGVRSDAGTLHSLDMSKVESVNIIKGPAAMKLVNDPAAANGVIQVKMKK